jgi:hypothetical protein
MAWHDRTAQIRERKAWGTAKHIPLSRDAIGIRKPPGAERTFCHTG